MGCNICLVEDVVLIRIWIMMLGLVMMTMVIGAVAVEVVVV